MNQFKCRKCGHDVIDRVDENVTVYTSLYVNNNGNLKKDTMMTFIEPNVQTITRWQCAECGWDLPCKSHNELIEYLGGKA